MKYEKKPEITKKVSVRRSSLRVAKKNKLNSEKNSKEILGKSEDNKFSDKISTKIDLGIPEKVLAPELTKEEIRKKVAKFMEELAILKDQKKFEQNSFDSE